eukprot:Tamp_11068.p1 GENE.Tamp_11068~~Tamp_11068.p1  ORF type:complete len:338 (-),score=26.68 Tamp_11068:126-1139(-)
MFVGERKVEVTQGGNWRLLPDLVPGPGQVLLETVSSAVSTGTELKVFRGDFDQGAQLDTTIKDMKEETLAYPLAYGYSLVGKIVRVGPAVDEAKWLHRLVFAFAPHGSHVVVAVDSTLPLPHGVRAEDACYLPAVETALSLVQDAHPRVGDTVAVFGQGLIGILVAAILSANLGPDKVVAVEPNPHRAAVARRVGCGNVLDPTPSDGTPFSFPENCIPDISIEVTGNYRALQAALDHTGRGGRVILGSWYGSSAAPLTLGLDFHRSQLSIKCSQVSHVPADMSGRWDKARRFAEAWRWLRKLRPSSFLTTTRLPLSEAQVGYELLDKGQTLGVQFTY